LCEGLSAQIFFLICSAGDPRIQEAKITWVGSDATSWVKHTNKGSKGEPAVEIVVEKNEAMQNGDAWRIVMDACIPVINLIDTRRSIPYGIQQVRKLIGISCSFDQVVQVRPSCIWRGFIFSFIL
jgi:DNA-directed RNA polymerase-5 subunit 1